MSKNLKNITPIKKARVVAWYGKYGDRATPSFNKDLQDMAKVKS